MILQEKTHSLSSVQSSAVLRLILVVFASTNHEWTESLNNLPSCTCSRRASPVHSEREGD